MQLPLDTDLLADIQAHKACAFTLLMQRYQEALRRHLQRFVRDKDTIEDLLQEVFLRVWTHAEQWNGSGSCKAWLFRIATNLALNTLRSSQRHPQQPLDLIQRAFDDEDAEDETRLPAWMVDLATLEPDEAIVQAERYEQLQRVIGTLPEEKRAVFRLIREEGMEISEVAGILGIPVGTVKSRLHYATKHVARQWRDSAYEE